MIAAHGAWLTPVRCFLISSVAASAITIPACLLFLRQFWRRGGPWRWMLGFALLVLGHECLGWTLYLLHIPNLPLYIHHDLVRQVLTMGYLFALCREMKRELTGFTMVGLYGVLWIICQFVVRDATFTNSLQAACVFGAVLTTMINLYFWEGAAGKALERLPQFWVLASLLVLFASLSSHFLWIHVALACKETFLGVAFPLTVLPDLLAAIYLLLATWVDRHA